MDRLRLGRLLAQLLLLGVAGSMLLPWSRADAGGTAVQGVDVNEGVLVLVAAVVAIGLVQVGLRPAWMGAGFIVAVLGRQLLAGPASESPGIGVILGFLAGLAALVLLLATLVGQLGSAADQPSAA